ncbi:MAG: proton-conducting transporter membrane subunit [Thermus sp.]|nr:proton-conducting transporter membrane subunit [Thermus sp.]
MPGLGITFGFYLDGFSLLFSLLILGIGAIVLLYGASYLEGHPYQDRFFVFILAFMGSMLGLVLAGDLITLFVFWELTSLTSFLLVGLDHHRPSARRAALQALFVTVFGGLFLLAGLVLVALAGGSYSLEDLLGQDLTGHPNYLPILFLLALGAFAKSAQFPFHFWLPNAMEAPTPVSAYLHSATMVKAGVYLLGRFHPILGDTEIWHGLLTAVGGVTMLLGAFSALVSLEIKPVLAYSTVSVLGLLIFLLGVGSEGAIKAMVLVLLAHALYKGALFLVAGSLDHGTGEKKVENLGGLGGAMPWTALGGFLAALSMMGFPPAVGFVAKEFLYKALEGPLLVATFLTSLLLVGVAVLAGIKPFLGNKPAHLTPHESPWPLWSGPVVLGLTGLVLGLGASEVGRLLVAPAVADIMGEEVSVRVYLWGGFNLAFFLSLVTVLTGVAAFLLRSSLRRLSFPWEADQVYDRLVLGLERLAKWQTGLLQHGYVRLYAATVLGVGLLVTLLPAFRLPLEWPLPMGVRPYEALVLLLMAVAAFYTARSRSPIFAVVALGLVGYGIALVYLFYGAPDLAMTQLLVETLTVLVFAFVFAAMPPFAKEKRVPWKALLGVGVGAAVTLGILLTSGQTKLPPVSQFFAEKSYVSAFGRNVVNVILVDFRALDTLGEVVVLVLAGLGAYALLRRKNGNARA